MQTIRRLLPFVFLILMTGAVSGQAAPRDAAVTVDNPTASEGDEALKFTVTAAGFDPGEEFIIRAYTESESDRSPEIELYFSLKAARPQKVVLIGVHDNYVVDGDYSVTLHLEIHTWINGTPHLMEEEGIGFVTDNDVRHDFTIGTFEVDSAGWGGKGLVRTCGGAGYLSDCAMMIKTAKPNAEKYMSYSLNLSGINLKRIRYVQASLRYKTGAGGAVKARITVTYKNGKTSTIRSSLIGGDTGGNWGVMSLAGGLLQNVQVRKIVMLVQNLSRTDTALIDSVSGFMIVAEAGS